MEEFKTKKDIVIPAGTIFKSIQDEEVNWRNDEFETTIKSNDGEMQFLVMSKKHMQDNPEVFEDNYK